jgi:heme oxygenase
MNSKAGAFSELAKNRKQDRLASDKVFVLFLAGLGLMAAITIVYLAAPLANPVNSPASPAGIEASTARWATLGAQYAPDLEASVEASTARWTALGQAFGDAYTARWATLGAQYAPDLEASVEASTARWTALGQAFNDAYTARWVALGAQYAPDLEASVEASTARWTALGQAFGDAYTARGVTLGQAFSTAQTGLGRSDPVRNRSGISRTTQETDATEAYAPNGPFDS